MYQSPIKLTALSDVAKRIARAAYPTYRGRKWRVQIAERVNMRSYWDGGSRDYFVLVRMSDFAVMPMPTSHPAYDRVTGVDDVELQPGVVVVQHTIFCGKDLGLTFIITNEDQRRLAA